MNLEKKNIDHGKLISLVNPNESVTWVKACKEGFRNKTTNQVFREIVGVITHTNFYYIKWTNGSPHKIASVGNNRRPLGYNVAIDLYIQTQDIRLATSVEFSDNLSNLGKYTLSLRSQGLELDGVITKISSHAKMTDRGEQYVIDFERQNVAETDEDHSVAENQDNSDSIDLEMPFDEPSSDFENPNSGLFDDESSDLPF